MLAGYLPYDDDPANPDGDNINLLYKYILATSLVFPDYISPDARDLLRKMLVPDPRRRCTMDVIKQHRWLSAHAHIFEETYEDDDIAPLPSNLSDAEVNAATKLSYQQPAASATQLVANPPSSLAPPVMTANHKRHTIQLEYNNNPMEIEPLMDGTEIGAHFRDDHALNPEGLHAIQGSSSTSLSGDQSNGDGTNTATATTNTTSFPSPPISPQPNWSKAEAEDAAATNKQNKKPPSRPTKTRPTTMMHYSRMAEEEDVIADLPLPNHTTRSERHRSMAGDNASIHSNGSRGNDSDSGRERRSNLTSILFDRRSSSNSNSVPGRTGNSKRKAFSEVMSGGLGHLFNYDNESRAAANTTLIASGEQSGTETTDNTRRNKMNSRSGHSTSTAKKVMDWFRKRSLGKAMHRDDHPRRAPPSNVAPGHDVKLRTHGGAIDEGALTSRPPKEVVAEIRTAILEMGLEILRESEFKFKCMRPNKTAPKRTTTAGSSTGHDTASSSGANTWKRTSTLRGLLGRRMSVPHAVPGHHGISNDGPTSVIGSTRAASNSSTSVGVPESEAAYAALMAQTTIQPVYGEASIDAGDEIRFVVEICKIKNLTNLYIVDIRRMKGSIWSYKFLYHNLLERLDLKSKGFMNVQGDGTLA
jgi:serine/threonine protein kinase